MRIVCSISIVIIIMQVFKDLYIYIIHTLCNYNYNNNNYYSNYKSIILFYTKKDIGTKIIA